MTLQPSRALSVALLVLTACAAPAPGPQVSGRVVDSALRPRAGVEVRIGSRRATTAADGSFRIDGVAPPYDAAVLDFATAVVFRGLTRRDPTLTVPALGLATTDAPARQASISGALSGGPDLSANLNPGATGVLFVSAEATGWGGANAGDVVYEVNPIRWSGGPGQTTGKLRALQGAFTLDGPFQSFAYTECDVTVRDGEALQTVDLALAPVAAGAIAATVGSASGGPVAVDVSASFADGGTMSVNRLNGAIGEVSLPVPRLPGATYAVEASEGGVGWATVGGLAPDVSGVALELPPPPALTAPVDGAVDFDGATPLRWSGTPGGVYYVTVSTPCSSVGVITATPELILRDLAWMGIELPGSAPGWWSVRRYAPLANADAAASPDGIAAWFPAARARSTPISVTWSAERWFTTGPGTPCGGGGATTP